jgi:hypothetical protein
MRQRTDLRFFFHSDDLLREEVFRSIRVAACPESGNGKTSSGGNLSNSHQTLSQKYDLTAPNQEKML